MKTTFMIYGLVMLHGVMVQAAPKPAPVDAYAIHADGGIVYDPLRREAVKTGQLDRYRDAECSDRDVQLDGCKLHVCVPKHAAAYDVVPIRYELDWESPAAKPAFPIAVEAAAFEDESRRKGRDLFDLALPGRIDLDVEYLGSMTAHLRPGARHNMKPDLSDTPAQYPPFDRKPFVRSGVVEAGDLVWFKVRFTNTGNTILDSEGFGGYLIYPLLLAQTKNGTYEQVGNAYNLYYRDLGYLYPGESRELWIHLCGNGETPQGFGITPGEYKLQFRIFYRCYKTPDVFLDIWEGPQGYGWEVPIKVEAQPREAPVPLGKKTFTDGDEPDKITRFIHTFEEFMTAFDCHQRPPADGASKISGMLYLQVAPWTKHAILKLVGAGTGGPVRIASVAVPIEVNSDSLNVVFDSQLRACIVRNGLREPIIASMTLADMRANVQMGPFPEKTIPEGLREMRECGVNVLTCDAMPWLYSDKTQPKSNYQGDALKYVLDVARREGLPVDGWGAYPYDQSGAQVNAEWITGKTFNVTDYVQKPVLISLADPVLPRAHAAVWLYQFERWGDLYLQLENGQVPIDEEDTRGWMRQDVNARLPMGSLTVKTFRDWLRHKYTNIADVNAAWGTSFRSFDAIDPEKDQVQNQFGHLWEYVNKENPFHDWNDAVADLDTFRTELRVQNYRDTLAEVRKRIPEATICLRTEGGNVLAGGLDPQAPNAHLRHAYFSQRRCAIIAEILQQSGIVKFHSDYTTIPYTPSELRTLVRTAVSQGITPMYFPVFENMRDIAINTKYGSDYQIHYNLPEPRKGYMMHCLAALYPWFKASYEEGGIPGILWEDYQCDGFATETQKREMRLFHEKLAAALSTPEAQKVRAANVQQPSQDWRKGSRGKWSYRFEDAAQSPISAPNN